MGSEEGTPKNPITAGVRARPMLIRESPGYSKSRCIGYLPYFSHRCGWNAFHSPKPNPIVLQGALVGGPDKRDKYVDDRKNFKSNEVTLDHNSCFQVC